MLDERSASWKLLVPGHRRERLLVVGLDPGGVAGLARWWGNVVWVPASREASGSLESLGSGADEHLARVHTCSSINGNETQYDAAVVASWPRSEQPDVARIASLLAPDGVLVSLGFAGSALTLADLKRRGFNDVQCYAALPAGRPRLFFSTASRAMRSKGLSFHVPGSRRARWLVRASRHLSASGLRRHLHRGAVLIASRDRDPHPHTDLARWLSQQLGHPLHDLVIYAGSESPARKLTALAVADDGHDDVVVKLADTTAAAAALRRESEALTALAHTPVGPHLPRLLLERAWRDSAVQVQHCVPSDSLRQVPRLNERLMRLLVELSHTGRAEVPARATAAWQRIEECVRNGGGDKVPPAVARCAQQMACPEVAGQHVVCHRTHGDFAPWNIKWHGDRLFVVDWEASEPSGLALSDACHFIYRRASLVGPWPGGPAMLRMLRTTCEKLARRAELPAAGVEAALRLWMLDEYLSQPSAHILELVNAAAGGQQWPDA